MTVTGAPMISLKKPEGSRASAVPPFGTGATALIVVGLLIVVVERSAVSIARVI